eukprot:TRINITY_DN17478_c0_g1_i1.p1 TRINITY_DN17478_c0_g1~~TRINITY_DN17478_c0_g1_i1.p1  ORF type:complete len:552 (-),score=72.96 TRINITY_DN17478_c0_g1_i1:69-1520(-)
MIHDVRRARNAASSRRDAGSEEATQSSSSSIALSLPTAAINSQAAQEPHNQPSGASPHVRRAATAPCPSPGHEEANGLLRKAHAAMALAAEAIDEGRASKRATTSDCGRGRSVASRQFPPAPAARKPTVHKPGSSSTSLLGDLPEHWKRSTVANKKASKCKPEATAARHGSNGNGAGKSSVRRRGSPHGQASQSNTSPGVRPSEMLLPPTAKPQNEHAFPALSRVGSGKRGSSGGSKLNLSELGPNRGWGVLAHQEDQLSDDDGQSAAQSGEHALRPGSTSNSEPQSRSSWRPAFEQGSLMSPQRQQQQQRGNSSKLSGPIGSLLQRVRSRFEGDAARLLSGEFRSRTGRADLADPRSRCNVALDVIITASEGTLEPCRTGSLYLLPCKTAQAVLLVEQQAQQQQTTRLLQHFGEGEGPKQATVVVKSGTHDSLNVCAGMRLRLYDPILLTTRSSLPVAEGTVMSIPVLLCTELCDVCPPDTV